MQKMIRWQVEAVKSEITGAVFGFRIVTIRHKQQSIWVREIPDEVEYEYSIFSQSLDDLHCEEYMKLLKINFIKAFEKMNEIASDFKHQKELEYHPRIGLNWLEYIWEEKDEDYIKI